MLAWIRGANKFVPLAGTVAGLLWQGVGGRGLEGGQLGKVVKTAQAE